MRNKKIKIAPSLLAADAACFGAEALRMQDNGAEILHFDVMDGVYVPNISFGMDVLRSVKKHVNMQIDAHLMVTQPGRYIEAFADAGADIITIHCEAEVHIHRAIQSIKAAGKKAGIALNPGTHQSAIEYLLDDIDLVLVMTVNPGFGGQALIPQVIHKISEIRKMIDDRGLDTVIEVDGGVNVETARQLIAAGADILVCGTALFKSENPAKLMKQLAGEEA